ncbi:response regulator transcription factor [Shewanella sp. Isolate11]|uniref:response regulator transcription factor n=1 Tax=Shewanella sp. Isolate11 TaxID=2908530 RepID=UPI001EFDA2A2|nr:response regulator transcription factor [Shewanella sp. Isolate11]MCG9695882.1 response regulator transcription factor [Shewanella sp. Isolate11]
MTQIHIALADDHPLFVYAIKEKLKKTIKSITLEEARNYQELFRIVQRAEQSLDLVIVDLSMPGSEGLQGIRYISETYPSVPILVVSGHDDFSTRQSCLDAGASEFVSKSECETTLIESVCNMITEEFQEVEDNTSSIESDIAKMNLTPSQKKVLALLSNGLSNKLIARDLKISEKTVRIHASAIYKQLGVENRTQAAIKYKTVSI